MLDIPLERQNYPEISRLFPIEADFRRERSSVIRRNGGRNRYAGLRNPPYVSLIS